MSEARGASQGEMLAAMNARVGEFARQCERFQTLLDEAERLRREEADDRAEIRRALTALEVSTEAIQARLARGDEMIDRIPTIELRVGQCESRIGQIEAQHKADRESRVWFFRAIFGAAITGMLSGLGALLVMGMKALAASAGVRP